MPPRGGVPYRRVYRLLWRALTSAGLASWRMSCALKGEMARAALMELPAVACPAAATTTPRVRRAPLARLDPCGSTWCCWYTFDGWRGHGPFGVPCPGLIGAREAGFAGRPLDGWMSGVVGLVPGCLRPLVGLFLHCPTCSTQGCWRPQLGWLGRPASHRDSRLLGALNRDGWGGPLATLKGLDPYGALVLATV